MIKKLLSLFVLAFATISHIDAQVNYTFTALPGTYTAITGTTLTPTDPDDGFSNNVPLNFTLNYNGTLNVSAVHMSTNGYLALGSALTTSSATNNLTGGEAANRPLLAPLWDDISCTNIQYTTTGPVGSRVFTMQWTNAKWDYSATNNTMNMQVRLFETTNVIEFQYQALNAPQSGTFAPVPAASIGITAAATGSPNFMSLSAGSSSPTVSTVSETTNINTVPPTGTIYRFTPNFCGPVNGGNATASTMSYNCSGTPTLNLTGATTPTTGIQYVWQSSPPGLGSWTNISGNLTSPSFTPASPVTETTDFRCVVSCTSSGNTANSQPVTVTIIKPNAVLSGSPTTCAGDPGQITVSFSDGTAPYSITYTDGVTPQTITNINANPYTFSVTPTSTTGYSLVSVNDVNCAGIVSGSAIVNVNPLPMAGINATATEICAGESVDIIFAGTPDATIIYYENGNQQTAVLDNSGFFTLTVTPTTAGNIGYVPFSVESIEGCTQSLASQPSVDITVNASPTATITNAGPSTICVGTASSVNINLGGSAGPWTFTYSDGTNSVTETNYAVSTYNINTTLSATTTYTVTNLEDVNNGCVAQSADISDDETINVEHPATITDQPTDVTECTGDNASISVSATGDGLVYQWTVNGNPINTNDPLYIGSDQATLMIPNISGMNGNTYAVTITGNCGSPVTSNSVTLTENLTNTWDGSSGTAWSDPDNWSCNIVPVVTTNVIIPSAPLNQPLVDIPGAVCNNIIVDAGASLMFTGAGNQLAVHGDLTNNGTLDADGGKVMLAGAVTQQVSGVATFDDLEIAGGSTKTLTNDVTIAGILTFTSGYLELGEHDLTITDMTIQNTGSAASFVVTNDSGLVIGQNMGNTPVMFPIGFNSGTYTPVMLENEGDADTFSVRVMEHVYKDGYGVNPDEVISPVVDRTWLVSEQTTGGSFVNMTPHWNVPQEINGFDQNHVYIGHFINGNWQALTDDVATAPSAVLSGSLYTAYADSIENFSPFTVASFGQFPLSIDKLTLTGKQQGENVLVNWVTVNEKDVLSFDVERSVDGKTYTKVGNQKAIGTDRLKENKYSLTDATATKLGKNRIYYRLRILETDGVDKFSKVVPVDIASGNAAVINLYPNPVPDGKDKVFVSLDNSYNGAVSVQLMDMYGKTISTMIFAEGQYTHTAIPLTIKGLPAGVYLVHVADKNNKEMQVLKLVKE